MKEGHVMQYYSGIGHYVDKIQDIFSYKAEGKDYFTVVLAARLSGKPHIGTLINFLSGFKLATDLQKEYKKDVSIRIELLDNISDTAIADILSFGTDCYFYKSLVDTNKVIKENYLAFLEMIERIRRISDHKCEVCTYEKIQSEHSMRQSVLEVMQHYDFFSRLFHPNDPKLHIRIACPHCGLIEKSCNHTYAHMIDDASFKIESLCPVHGPFSAIVTTSDDVYIDINVPLRHFCKGFSLVRADKANNSLSIQVLGNDWTGLWPIRTFCEGMLRFDVDELPNFLFSPLILDENGKISKSKIGTVSCDPFENVALLTDEQLKNVWDGIERWFARAELFFANYRLDEIREMMSIDK